MDWMAFLENGIWFGFASLGFAILFNVPTRTLFFIFIISAMGGLLKLFLLSVGLSIIFSSLIGASLIGYASVYAAHIKHSPPIVFAIPAVIPMVPGVYTYKMMLGILNLVEKPRPEHQEILLNTISYGLTVVFILLSLSFGVTLPLLVLRKESIKDKKK